MPADRRDGPGGGGWGAGRGGGRRGHAGTDRRERADAPFKPSPYKVGDAVTLHNGQSGAEALLTVTGFSQGGRRMEVSDGGFWRADGKRLWRAGDGFYRGPWLEPTVPADAERVRRRRLVGMIRKFASGLDADQPYDTERLAEIVEIIRAETERTAASMPSDEAAADSIAAHTMEGVSREDGGGDSGDDFAR